MIHATRTNLLMIKARARAVVNSIRILKARKQALIREFLATTRPFLQSRTEIRQLYGNAASEMALSLGHEGNDSIESITAVTARDFTVSVTEKNVWGLQYKEVVALESAVRDPGCRGYDYLSTTHHLEDAILHFEKIVDAMVDLAAFESKLKRLGEEIVKTTRRIKVLEERILPDYRSQAKIIADHIEEREREAFCRLKRFKEQGLAR